jgi:hypothetical protein
MVVKVYEKEGPVVRLKLEDVGDGVRLIAVNEGGNIISHIARITNDGIKLIGTVDTDLGFPLDVHGRVKINVD